jgi:hypothetical protein
LLLWLFGFEKWWFGVHEKRAFDKNVRLAWAGAPLFMALAAAAAVAMAIPVLVDVDVAVSVSALALFVSVPIWESGGFACTRSELLKNMLFRVSGSTTFLAVAATLVRPDRIFMHFAAELGQSIPVASIILL